MDIREEVHQLARKHLRKVKRSGPNDIMAICPFHQKMDGSEEKTPSFAMSLANGLFFCHSCHAKGNLLSFLRGIGLTRDVIERGYRFLIDQARGNVPAAFDPLRPQVFDMSPINESILGLFEYAPVELINAGFMQETLFHFEVGYDQWHGRITYPLRDLKGKLVGLMGRNPDGVNPRYKVYTDEYPLWGLPARSQPEKRLILWNADKVYPSLYFNATRDPVIVVEGFKACMWVFQAGLKNVVALLGSYMSEEHRWILERIGAPVYLFLDNNAPGRRGSIHSAEALSRSLDVHVVNYPSRLVDDEDAQPDDCFAEEVIEAIGSAPTYLRWLMQWAQ